MLEAKNPLKPKGKRRNSNKWNITIWSGCNNDLFAGLTNRSKLLSHILDVCSHTFACLYIEESERSCIGSNHNQLILRTVFQTGHFDIFLEIYGSNYFKGLLSFSANSNLIIKPATNKNIHVTFRLLSCNQMGNFSKMFSQIFHLRSICRIVKCNISFSISNNHPLF